MGFIVKALHKKRGHFVLNIRIWEGTRAKKDHDMADEVGEDKEMDDKERMKDLAPVSLWQARRQEKEFTRYNFRTSTNAPWAASTYIHRRALN